MRRQILFYLSFFCTLFFAQACGQNFFAGMPIGACADMGCTGYDAPGQSDDGSFHPGDQPDGNLSSSSGSGSTGSSSSDSSSGSSGGWIVTATGFNGELEYFDAEGMLRAPQERPSQVVNVVAQDGEPEL